MLGVMLMLFGYVKHTHILCLYMHKMEQQFLPKSRCEKSSFLVLSLSLQQTLNLCLMVPFWKQYAEHLLFG